MKRIATFAAMLALVACGAKKDEAPKMDSAAAPAMAPAAAPAPAMAAPADSTKKDSAAMAAPAAMKDTTKKM